MGDFTIYHALAVLLSIGAALAYWVPIIRILNRAGYSGWWSLILLVPLGNILGLWIFADADWPALRPAGDTGAIPSPSTEA
jgi:hypothetical protein